MDEPTSNLDYGNQQRVMSQVCRLAEGRGMGVILATHDPNHALQHASRALVLDGRGRCAFGRPSAAVTEAYLRDTCGVNVEIRDIPLRQGHARICVRASFGEEGGGAKATRFPKATDPR